ncbi:hypothetical protein HMPREF3215_01642, partial [Staphylococcus simulans]
FILDCIYVPAPIIYYLLNKNEALNIKFFVHGVVGHVLYIQCFFISSKKEYSDYPLSGEWVIGIYILFCIGFKIVTFMKRIVLIGLRTVAIHCPNSCGPRAM